MRNAQNQYILTFDAVDDDIFANGKTSGSGTNVLVAATAQVRVARKKEEPVGDASQRRDWQGRRCHFP